MATTSAKETGQGAWQRDARALSGPAGPAAAGSPPTPHGRQTSRLLPTELGHRESGQYRDLHPRSPDSSLRSHLHLHHHAHTTKSSTLRHHCCRP